jgi:hypothetical protein
VRQVLLVAAALLGCAPAPSGPDTTIDGGTTGPDGGSVDPCTDGDTYLGCRYLATQLANSQLADGFSYAVILSNPQEGAVSVTIEGGALSSARTVELAAGEVEAVELPWVASLRGKRPSCFNPDLGDPDDCAARSTLARGGAYRITASAPIAAYQFNPLRFQTAGTPVRYSYTNDASLLLPVDALDDHYIVVTHENWANDTLGVYSDPITIIHGGLVAVTASADDTSVAIDLTASVWSPTGGQLAPGRHEFSLDEGDVLQLLGTAEGEDLTGTIVRADHPVAVFTGHDCAEVPDGRRACDHLEEQLIPSATWGKRYVVTQLVDRRSDEESIVKLVSQSDGNTLTFVGIDPPTACTQTLARGQACLLQTVESFEVSGTQPFLVVQMMMGQGTQPYADEICQVHSSDYRCDPFTGGPATWCQANPDDDMCEGYSGWCANHAEHPSCVGDPAMVTEVPVDQFRASYDLLVPDTYALNFASLVAPRGADITVDGDPIPEADWTNVGAEHAHVTLPLSPGPHHLSSGEGFGVKVYGVALWTSYAYPGGLDLEPIYPID